jgi:hypothetical protein
LYERLVEIVAENPDLLRILNKIEHRPQPNLLFAGVQYLLMRDPTVPLAAHYPNLAGGAERAENLKPSFRDFVLDREDELVDIGRTRYTQTNECRRCAVLLPMIWLTPLTRFHLIDVGASAGLNLHLDRYQYAWGKIEWGNSPVRLETESRGAGFTRRSLEILSRTGLDLNPVDAADPDERMWLEALIWPEHESRRERLKVALDLATAHPVELVAGDALETLPTVLDGLPSGEPAVVMHSFAMLQVDKQGREKFRHLIDGQRARRPIYRIAFEAIGRSDGAAELIIDDDSGLREVGVAHPHGEWLEFYARP